MCQCKTNAKLCLTLKLDLQMVVASLIPSPGHKREENKIEHCNVQHMHNDRQILTHTFHRDEEVDVERVGVIVTQVWKRNRILKKLK